MKTFVIRCNDSVEAVVIGDEQFAREEMERRRAAEYDELRISSEWWAQEFDAVVQPDSEIHKLRAFVDSAARCGEYADGEDLEAAVSMLRDDARKLL